MNMLLKPSKNVMDTAIKGDTRVLILSEKACPIKQYQEQSNSFGVLNQIAKVVVSTETNKLKRRGEDRKTDVTKFSAISEVIYTGTYVPMLTVVPKDFGSCPLRGIFQGYVHTMKAMNKLKDQYEALTSSRFILYARSNSFGDGDWMEGKHRVAWEIAPNSRPGISLPFQGIPFFIVGHAIYDCQHGRKRKPFKTHKIEGTLPGSYKKRKSPQQNSIKIGCPAQLLMREVIMFPEFKLSVDTLKRRQLMSQRVRKGIELHIKGKDMVQTERRIYVYFPRSDEHHHNLNRVNTNGTVRSVEPVDPKIVKKIQELVSQGLTGTKKIREHVDQYVKVMFQGGSPPPLERRRYNPSDQDIRNAMKKARTELKKAKRKKMELQCSTLMHGIREHLSTVKSEYLMQLRDHLSYLSSMVKKEESLEPLLLCSQAGEANEQETLPVFKKIKIRHLKAEITDTTTELVEIPDQTILRSEYNGPNKTLLRADHNNPEILQSQQPDKHFNLKYDKIGSLMEVPESAAAPSCYAYGNEYENGEPNQIIYQEEVPPSQETHMEGVTEIYYYQKIPSQGDLYVISNQADCSQVPYNINEFMKEPLN